MPSDRTSRRSGASFRSPLCASNSASRCDQLSGFHNKAIVFRLCTTTYKDCLIGQLEGISTTHENAWCSLNDQRKHPAILSGQ
jgi:hypothetical protein